MRLTPTERDRLLIFTAAELARTRQARGLQLNAPEATALIADTVIEAARDGQRLRDAVDAGCNVLEPDDVLPGVAALVPEVWVEAVFDDGSRLVVVPEPLGPPHGDSTRVRSTRPATTSPPPLRRPGDLEVHNTSDVPISVTSHFHFFEVNPRLGFDRAAAYGMRLAIDAGEAIRFDPQHDRHRRARTDRGRAGRDRLRRTRRRPSGRPGSQGGGTGEGASHRLPRHRLRADQRTEAPA